MLNGPSATSAPKNRIKSGGGRSSVPADVINSSMSAASSAEPHLQTITVQRARGERVIYRAVREQSRKLPHGHEHDLGMLGRRVRDLADAHDALRIKTMQPIVEQRGVRIHAAERDDARRAIARLLEALARGRGGRRLAR